MQAREFTGSYDLLHTTSSRNLFAKAGGIGAVPFECNPCICADNFDGANLASFGILDLIPRNEYLSSPPPMAFDSALVCNDRLGPCK
jgi:hypothetical protein